jgi:DNA processing protein
MGPWRFPERNRLIAALADAVVVIEAPERSGALLTAHLALELGRDIFVVPGPITFPHNLGGHRLIQQGAQLLTHGREIFASLGFTARPESGGTFPQVAPTAEEQSLLEILSGDPLHVDKIVLISHLPAPSVMARLMDLCLKGWVVELAGGYYKKVCNFI